MARNVHRDEPKWETTASAITSTYYHDEMKTTFQPITPDIEDYTPKMTTDHRK